MEITQKQLPCTNPFLAYLPYIKSVLGNPVSELGLIHMDKKLIMKIVEILFEVLKSLWHLIYYSI